MTKWMALPAAFVAAAALTVSVEAAPKANGKSTTKTTKAPATSTQGSSTKAKGPSKQTAKADHAGASKAKGSKSTTTTAKNNGSSKKSSTSAASGSTTTTTTTTTGTEWKPTNPVAEKLMTKPNQLAKLKAVLPAGTDINAATAGFKNFGQLNAAVNASQNLGITFADLKAAMTGTTLDGKKTGEPTKSLGQAIKQYRPEVDADAAAATATTQATREAGQ